MKYFLKPGCRIHTAAQTVGKVCADLEKDGRLTAKDLVDVSRPEDAPLHREFEWNDEVAGELYREEQARHIIRSIVIVNERKEPERIFYNVSVKSPVYHSIDRIFSDKTMTDDLFATARRELFAIRRKYRQIKALARVFKEIDDLPKRLEIEGEAGDSNSRSCI